MFPHLFQVSPITVTSTTQRPPSSLGNKWLSGLSVMAKLRFSIPTSSLWRLASPLVSLKGSRSMTACSPQEALARLWVESSPPLPPPRSKKFLLWLGGEVSLSPGSSYSPFDLKANTGLCPPEDMLGASFCHTGGLQALQSNRRRNHMFWPFGKCHCPCQLH